MELGGKTIDLREFIRKNKAERRFYKYIRFSSRSQEEDQAQERYLDKFLEQNTIPLKNIEKVSITLKGNLTTLKIWKDIPTGSLIICTELSRISRSMDNLIRMLDSFDEKKVSLIFLYQPDICILWDKDKKGNWIKLIEPMTKTYLHLRTVFAELEKEMINKRVRSGLQAWKNTMSKEALKEHYKKRNSNRVYKHTALTPEDYEKIRMEEQDHGRSRKDIYDKFFSHRRFCYLTFLKKILCRFGKKRK